MKYLAQLILLLFPLLLTSPHLFASEKSPLTEEEKSKQAIAEEECT